MSKYEIIIPAAFGVEASVAFELKRMGMENIKTENGRVVYYGDETDICKINMGTACGERVLIRLAAFEARTFDELFDGVKSIPWEDYVPSDAAVTVDAKSVKSDLFSLSDCQKISKKAIVERIKMAYRTAIVPETGTLYPVIVSLRENLAEIFIDTSGEGLHRRGYRENAGAAPLKETLAATMVDLSVWKASRPLVDPMCGSGTILIEAVYDALRTAPNKDRNFISKTWGNIPSSAWREAREMLEAREEPSNRELFDICGYDIDDRVLSTARKNASKAGVGDCISFHKRSFEEFSTQKKYGCIITNPPYGERMGDRAALKSIYKRFGEILNSLDTWSFFILTADENFEDAVERKADKKRKLYNGRIKTQLYQFMGKRPPKERA
ncbi:MAG: class I SAM-dependent RNA methyltransferase [Clostridiales bacterium]|nr:class I SAM-dependent RNA methyltransferase [Clostridiales bacterium]